MAIEVRQIRDEELDERIGAAALQSLEGIYVDDVMAYTDLGLESLPSYRELYERALKQQWSPFELDFSRDRADWMALAPETQRRRLYTLRLFLGGEDRVASLLAPLVWAAPTKETSAFLATQLHDEVRHTIFFDRYWREVVDSDAPQLDTLLEQVSPSNDNPHYDHLFFKWLPGLAQHLASNPGDMEAMVEFVTLYHLVVEGALFLTGLRYHMEGARRWGRTFDFYRGFTATARDESRHVLFGVRFLRDMVAKDTARFAPVVRNTIKRCVPIIEGHLTPRDGDLSPYGGQNMAKVWTGYTPERMQKEVLEYAKLILSRRLAAIGVRVELDPVVQAS